MRKRCAKRIVWKPTQKSRAEEVRRWFKKSVTYEGEAYTIDAEQAEAVVCDNLNTIVVARAGSGKTRTIVAKVVYLIARCMVKPEEIMVFVFNANAAREINERLAKMWVEGKAVFSGGGDGMKKSGDTQKVKVATTFHAFARRIVYEACGGAEKCGKILVGEREAFIERIVRGVLGEGVEEMEVKRRVLQMVGFVNRAQQQFLGGKKSLASALEARLSVGGVNGISASEAQLSVGEVGEEEREFLRLGWEVYRRYHWYLLNARGGPAEFAEYGTDFNLIVSWASKLILARRRSVEELLSRVKYILVDEYQDFSQLFLSAVKAVRMVARESRLFVVGDDWQAINRFAGSEVKYFKEFERYFPEDAKRLVISTNYRCDYLIVETARKFMRKAMGERGEFRAFARRMGRVVLVDAKRTKERYLEILVRLVRENRKAKEILLLHRNNETNLKISLKGLLVALRREVARAGVMSGEEFDAKVRAMTMHKSKGLEAEVVIILEADEGVIPKTHPDTRLYAVFGETEEAVLDDQKRLFYVAMTRAKRRLYIMHDFGGDGSGGYGGGGFGGSGGGRGRSGGSRMGFIKYLGRGVERWEE